MQFCFTVQHLYLPFAAPLFSRCPNVASDLPRNPPSPDSGPQLSLSSISAPAETAAEFQQEFSTEVCRMPPSRFQRHHRRVRLSRHPSRRLLYRRLLRPDQHRPRPFSLFSCPHPRSSTVRGLLPQDRTFRER